MLKSSSLAGKRAAALCPGDEEQHHVTLFQRKPKLQLSAEGAAMVRYLSRIQALEDSMSNELADISDGIREIVRLGIPATRGAILIPRMVPEFQKQFPNVDVQIRLNDTRRLEQLLLSGEIDLFLGVDANEHPLYEKKLVCKEPLYLVISNLLLRSQFPDSYQETAEQFYQEGADLHAFTGLPLVLEHGNSTTTIAVRQFLIRHNINFPVPIEVSNFDIMVDLCKSGNYSTICARTNLRRLTSSDLAKRELAERNIHVFLVQGLEKTLRIETITHRDSQPLRYLAQFREMLNKAALGRG